MLLIAKRRFTMHHIMRHMSELAVITRNVQQAQADPAGGADGSPAGNSVCNSVCNYSDNYYGDQVCLPAAKG
jgi:hypothetical protein